MPRCASSSRPVLLDDGAGESALLVSEQFAFEQAGGQRRRVHSDERALATRTEVVDRARDQLLAGSRFAEDQHRAVGWRDRLDRRQRLAQGPAFADDLGEFLVELALEVLLFFGQPCVDLGEFLVRAGVLRGDGDLRRRLPEEGDLLFRERGRRSPSDVQRSDLSVAMTRGTQHTDSRPSLSSLLRCPAGSRPI